MESPSDIESFLRYQALSGIEQIAEVYDVFLIDIYGTILSGKQPIPGAVECLQKLSDLGKNVLLLSNVPIRSVEMIGQLDSMGVPPSLFQYVLTAGEDLHTRIDRGNDPFYGRLGDAYYYVGPSQSALLDDLPLRKKSELNEADFILVMGPDDWHDDLSEFSELLEEAVQLKLPMVCANPNIGGFETGELHWEAGAIGKLYQQLGGQVHYHGKPEQSFFKAALNCFDDTPITKIIHIGDSIEADVRGAQQCGLDVAFTPYGIHSEDVTVFDEPGLSLAKLGEKWFAANSMQLPTFLIPGFKW